MRSKTSAINHFLRKSQLSNKTNSNTRLSLNFENPGKNEEYMSEGGNQVNKKKKGNQIKE